LYNVTCWKGCGFVNLEVQRNYINIFVSDNVIGLVGEVAGHQERRVLHRKRYIKMLEGSEKCYCTTPWKISAVKVNTTPL
jgi:hypothetical protein